MPPGGLVLRRIVVALDGSAASRSALDAASRLAAQLHVELRGLFVEDVNLLRLAELPSAPHLSLSSGSDMRLDTPSLQRQLRALAEEARQALETAAARLALSGSFSVARGSVTAELLAAASEGALLILGRAGHSLARRAGLGETARAAVRQATGPVLLLPPGASLDGPVAVVEDGSPGAPRALETAAALAETLGQELWVLVVAASQQEAADSGEACKRALEAAGRAARIRTLIGVDRLAGVLARERVGVLVLSADAALAHDARLVDEARCALLLTR
jgi:nucleotide-binding universal stress UspA family protein